MALTVGSRLGHHDVTALIGEEGMGQVFASWIARRRFLEARHTRR
jgi:hypothetical protein